MNFSEALRLDLDRMELSEAGLGQLIGISQQAVHKWIERGYPPLSRTKELRDLLGPHSNFAKISTQDLLQGYTSRTPNPFRDPKPGIQKNPASDLETEQSRLMPHSRFEMIAVKTNGLLLKEIPFERQTKDLVEAALLNTGESIRYADPRHLGEASCRRVLSVKGNGLLLAYVPTRLRSQAMYDTAVMNDPLALQLVPDEFKTVEMCQEAVSQNSSLSDFVPHEIMSEIESQDERPRMKG
jgi:hypothetical protein